ncbi:hypothetical protein C4K22_3291 [Pseudomonas chlororaphis subsp. aurantiaca]|nr:hypothetical protein C4K22_3291 [Pseudomonas chlororaphis subsp. aurantiaca]AZD42372.1 hypothetical protein C4K21_3298 [Pseudomonas chlororaphis subsp. aurantiaca]
MCRLALFFFGQGCAGAMLGKPWRRGAWAGFSGSGGAIDRGVVSAGKRNSMGLHLVGWSVLDVTVFV